MPSDQWWAIYYAGLQQQQAQQQQIARQQAAAAQAAIAATPTPAAVGPVPATPAPALAATAAPTAPAPPSAPPPLRAAEKMWNEGTPAVARKGSTFLTDGMYEGVPAFNKAKVLLGQ